MVESTSVEVSQMAKGTAPISGAPSAASDDLDRALVQFRALSDPTRLRIVAFLAGKERCACELGDAIDVPANLLSHHLKALREAGLIVGTRRGRWIDYRLHHEGFQDIGRLLAQIGHAPSSRLPQQPTAYQKEAR